MTNDTQRVITDKAAIMRVADALSSDARLDILAACADRYLSISDLSRQLSLPQSTVTNHVQALEEAELLICRSEAGKRGRQKLCKAVTETICFNLPKTAGTGGRHMDIDMPVGLFSRVSVTPPCGLANSVRHIGTIDFPGSFLLPERVSAGIVWFAGGWVEYLFPRNFSETAEVDVLELSFEACSETVDYNHDWPSDISVWVGDVLLGTWTCPGDFGKPRGLLNPAWWGSNQTQYGELNVWRVTGEGTFLNGEAISDVKPKDLNLLNSPTIKVRIGIAKDAANQGGVNLFGNTYGNYEQDIRLAIDLK